MKFVALVSGGKDSIFALMESIRHGHELVGCVHLAAPHSKSSFPSSPGDGKAQEEEEESYMYQTAASEVLATVVEECLGVPLVWHQRVGTSVNTSLVYQHAPTNNAATTTTVEPPQPSTTAATPKKDEVEDLYEALKTAQERFPGLEGVSSGAILSTYQRVRIEHVCSRLGLTSLSYLWRRAPQDDVLRDMISNHIHAVLVKTACPPGLVPRKHLNKSLVELESYFYQLHDKYQFHVCGEGGEYESLVLDCPIYKQRLVLDDVEIVETEDGVGILSIRQWHTEPKETTSDTTWMETTAKVEPEASDASNAAPAAATDIFPSRVVSYLPHVQRLPGGLLHLSEVMSPIAASSNLSEADGAVQEALVVFQLLERALKRHGASPQDVVLVHLYLSEISHFALINAHYRDFFGTFLPPSRSCVAIGKRVLPGGRRVLLDCVVQCGSGEYLRSLPPPSSSSTDANNENALQMGYAKAAQLNTTSKLREVLHVQSISHWAPTCVGPYSQANTVRSGLVFLAGQIGLIPTTMKLQNMWRSQLTQCWKNLASVLDSLQGGSLDHMLSCLVYVGTKVVDEEKSACFDTIQALSCQQINTNAGVIPGAVESAVQKTSNFGGYEDEQTMIEMRGHDAVEKTNCPLLFVSMPELPMGALVEVEVVAATQRAASCLAFSHYSGTVQSSNVTEKIAEGAAVQWNTGVDFGSPSLGGNKHIHVDITSRFFGIGCAASVIITANAPADEDLTDVSADLLLGDMMAALDQFFRESGSGLSIRAALHIRLYYIGASLTDHEICDDGTRLRSALASQTAARWPTSTTATSVVPVRAMKLSTKSTDDYTFLAMHVILADPVHLETEMWIRHGKGTA